MALEVDTLKIIKIKESTGNERLRMSIDEEGDLCIEQDGGNTIYLQGHLLDDFRNGVAKLFAGRPATRVRSHIMD